MSETERGAGDGRRWQIEDHERRLAALERLEPAVVINRLASLEKKVDGMTKALWAVAGAIVVAVITFALSVASGVIG